MKRSELNQIIRDAIGFVEKRGLCFPEFAKWGPEDWKKLGEDQREIVDNMLGWDVSDFGGNFQKTGLFSAEEMARYLGDTEHEKRYQKIFELSSARADEAMWNGEYFEQILPDIDEYKYQHGKGVLSDQLMGRYYAHALGLGYLMNPEHIKAAAQNIFRYNFRENFYDHPNMQRVYALYDDSGLLMTTWPHGGRPRFPFFYSEEVWSRTEYPLASVLAYQGCIKRL